jgi:hypothetical protein
MSLDDIIRRMTDFGGLDRVLEQQRRLMENALTEIARQAEEQRRLLRPVEDNLTALVEERKRLMEPAMHQLTEQLEEQRRILGPTLSEISRVAALQQELMEPAFEQVTRAYSACQLLAQPLEEQLTITRNLLDGLGSWANKLFGQAEEASRALNRQGEEASRVHSQFKLMVEASASAGPVIGFIAAYFDRAILDLNQFAQFRQSFASDVLDFLGRIQATEDEHEKEQLLEEIGTLFEQALAKQPRTRLSLEGFLQIVLTVVFFIWPHFANLRMEDRVMREFATVEKKVAHQLQGFGKEDSRPVSYVVTKAVRLRQGPSTEHKVLAVLQPNMVLEVHKSEGQWMLVEYFDYVDTELKSGWVYKRYLAEIKGESQSLPSQVNAERQRRQRLLVELLDQLDATHGAVDEALVEKYVRLLE